MKCAPITNLLPNSCHHAWDTTILSKKQQAVQRNNGVRIDIGFSYFCFIISLDRRAIARLENHTPCLHPCFPPRLPFSGIIMTNDQTKRSQFKIVIRSQCNNVKTYCKNNEMRLQCNNATTCKNDDDNAVASTNQWMNCRIKWTAKLRPTMKTVTSDREDTNELREWMNETNK